MALHLFILLHRPRFFFHPPTPHQPVYLPRRFHITLVKVAVVGVDDLGVIPANVQERARTNLEESAGLTVGAEEPSDSPSAARGVLLPSQEDTSTERRQVPTEASLGEDAGDFPR